MGAPAQAWQKAPGVERSRGGLLPIWAIAGLAWGHFAHVGELMPKNGGLFPSLSRYPLTRSVALVPLLGHSSAGGWREAPAEPLSGKPVGKRLPK